MSASRAPRPNRPALRIWLQAHGFEEHAMNPTLKTPLAGCPAAASYELRFRSLFNDGRALSFPCDRSGDVHLDDLSDRARANYFYARAVVGREFSVPAVVAH